MKRTTTTIAALLVATIATGAVVPAIAQNNAANDRPQAQQQRGGDGEGFRMRRDGQGNRMQMANRMQMRRGGAGQILSMVCSENGADRLQHMLLNIEQRTDPTDDQQALFDTFEASAIQAQTDFAAACATARPDPEQAEATDLVDQIGARLEIQQAHLDAMSAVLPDFEAFYDSLGDEQKQAMQPRRNADKAGGQRGGKHDGQRDGKRGEHRRGMNAPAAPAAPADQG